MKRSGECIFIGKKKPLERTSLQEKKRNPWDISTCIFIKIKASQDTILYTIDLGHKNLKNLQIIHFKNWKALYCKVIHDKVSKVLFIRAWEGGGAFNCT